VSRHNKSHSESLEFRHGKYEILDTPPPPIQSLNQNSVNLPAARHVEDAVMRRALTGTFAGNLLRFANDLPVARIRIATPLSASPAIDRWWTPWRRWRRAWSKTPSEMES